MRRLVLVALLVCACNCGPSRTAVTIQEGERLLDVSPDGRLALVGKSLAVPEDTDAPLVQRMELRDGSHAWPQTLLAQDARFLSEDRFAVVDRGSQLQLADRTGASEHIDGPVRPGIDASPACGCLVYLRGEGPDAVPVVLDLPTRTMREIAVDLAPAWLPMIALDGRSFFLVSSRSGLPALWRVPLDGSAPHPIVAQPSTDPLHPDPFPEGPERPLVLQDRLVFRSGEDVVAVAFDGRVLWRRPGLGAPQWILPQQQVAFGSGKAQPIDVLLRAEGPP